MLQSLSHGEGDVCVSVCVRACVWQGWVGVGETTGPLGTVSEQV